MTTNTARPADHGLLGVYLNDHLAGSTVGIELAHRLAASARDLPTAASAVLKQLTADIAQDRTALLEIMIALGLPARRYKVYAAWAAEKVGRLKLNGHLLARSPLSSLEELEMLRLGVEGKGAAWRTLRILAQRDRRLDAGRLDELISRAAHQGDLLENLRASQAERIFTDA